MPIFPIKASFERSLFRFFLALSFLCSSLLYSLEKTEGPGRIDLGYTGGKYLGLDESFAELEFLWLPRAAPAWQPILDAKGYALESGKLAASIGTGLRYFGHDPDPAYALGGNVFYDYRDAKNGYYHRIGVGLEYLSDEVDARWNGYFPLNHSFRLYETRTVNSYPNGYFVASELVEKALRGFDAELGRSLFCMGDLSFYGAVGTYLYRDSSGFEVVGMQSRLEATYCSFLRGEVCVNYSHAYHFQVQGKIVFDFPLSEIFSPFLPIHRQGVILLNRDRNWTWNW